MLIYTSFCVSRGKYCQSRFCLGQTASRAGLVGSESSKGSSAVTLRGLQRRRRRRWRRKGLLGGLIWATVADVATEKEILEGRRWLLSVVGSLEVFDVWITEVAWSIFLSIILYTYESPTLATFKARKEFHIFKMDKNRKILEETWPAEPKVHMDDPMVIEYDEKDKKDDSVERSTTVVQKSEKVISPVHSDFSNDKEIVDREIIANRPAHEEIKENPKSTLKTDGNGFEDLEPDVREQHNVPVFVMLPLDTVNSDGVFRYAESIWFATALEELRKTGIHGVAVDVWWGAVEHRPRRYDWAGYRSLFNFIASLGLKMQVVMAFHACGGNVGDNAEISLPGWVLSIAERDPDILFTDRPRDRKPGKRNKECISFFAEEEPGLLKGRSGLQCYADFMKSFRDEFSSDFGNLIEEVVVGTGPCGELRYPSYPEPNGWRFPGIGEFQCYDRRALASLARAAASIGHPEWGNAGPHDSGFYNSTPDETNFFRGWGGSWDSEYGKFFLSWYSGALLEHGERMIQVASAVFNVATPTASPSSGTLSQSTTLKRSCDRKLIRGNSGNSAMNSISGHPSYGSDTSLPLADIEPGIISYIDDEYNDQLPQNSGLFFDNKDCNTMGDRLGKNTPEQQDLRPNGSGGSISAPPSAYGENNEDAAGDDAQDEVLKYNKLSGRNLSVPLSNVNIPSRPSYASFRSSSVSEGLNTLEDWSWPSPAGPPITLAIKIAGVHWWYRTRSHAAELTAGYYNCDGKNGYTSILDLCARYGIQLTLTCVEMCDAQHPPEALCGPEGLLRQIREGAAAVGVPVGGENALPCFMPNAIDEAALLRVVYNTQPWGTPLQQHCGEIQRDSEFWIGERDATMMSSDRDSEYINQNIASNQKYRQDPSLIQCSSEQEEEIGSGNTKGREINLSESEYFKSNAKEARLPSLRSFTFLRLTPEMMDSSYQAEWRKFTAAMAINARNYDACKTRRRKVGLGL